MLRNILILSILVICSAVSIAQEPVWMTPNRGQWDDRIAFKADLQMGEMYIEPTGFTYYLHDLSKRRGHSHDGDEHVMDDEKYKAHVIKSHFENADWTGEVIVHDSSEFYSNYILGNNPDKWHGHIHRYSHFTIKNLYPGIDLIIDGRHGGLKYSFGIAPGVDPGQINLLYEGQDNIEIDEKGKLLVEHRFGQIIESGLKSWNISENGNKNVPVEFLLEGGSVKFKFPEGYSSNERLIIDPDLTFSTFSGSTSDNWGMSAAPDLNANLFGGGTCFGLGYPTSVGAYDETFNGGTVDISITKFTSDGSAQIYSTYIGGNGSETPNSMYCSPNNELYIFGVTSSIDFPMAGSPYDNSFNGGPNVQSNSNGLGFAGGADIYVARLSTDGSFLLSSTYVGGSETDGMNISALGYNYGDQYRGEIIVDESNNVYVASTTKSTDFPIVSGSQPTFGGVQDAVIFKMSADLSTMMWSTYFGGAGEESGNSIQVNSTGNVYFTGGTNSTGLNFPMGEDLTFNGGQGDGYVAQFNGANGNIVSGTYLGESEYDQSYFVQLDIDDQVYLFGQTESSWPITAGHYGNANSGQFIRKYNSSLTSIEWTTMIGAGTGHVEISPTAFLVSDCYDIYIAGWGGELNVLYSPYASNSTTNGFPVSPPGVAFQANTNGSNFYLGLLGEDALTFKYGTFMGGTNSSYNHVDGGTSRFDKAGRIYHAVCAACGGNPTGFTSTPGVWSETNQSTNCNMACFKFELSVIEPIITSPNSIVCLPDSVYFTNNTSNGNSFYWDFGDGSYSTEINPAHLYPGPGTYTVSVVVSDSNGCYSPDSVEFDVFIGDFQGGVVQPPAPICPDIPYMLEAFGGSIYNWSPGQFLDDSTSAVPIATIDQTTDFMVIIQDTCGIDTAYLTLQVYDLPSGAQDTSVCLGNTINFQLTGGDTYEWTPPTYLDDPNSSSPICTPANSITYNIEITTNEGCVFNETIDVQVYFDPPVPVLADSISICKGTSAEVTISGGEEYYWTPASIVSPDTGEVVIVSPIVDTWYYCEVHNACGSVMDSILVNVVEATITAGTDTIVCPGTPVNIWAQGGISYHWWPGNSLNAINTSQVIATPFEPTLYYVEGTDAIGCIGYDSVFVDVYPSPWIIASPDVYALYDDETQLWSEPSGPGIVVWTPAEYLSCVACLDPIANPNQNFGYLVTYTDENGCKATDSVYIYYNPMIYVPNTFTPDGNTMNPIFKAEGGNIKNFEMLIFDRWGELIFESFDMEIGWDGTYQGHECQDGTYTWKIKVIDYMDKEHDFVGHVNLLR